MGEITDSIIVPHRNKKSRMYQQSIHIIVSFFVFPITCLLTTTKCACVTVVESSATYAQLKNGKRCHLSFYWWCWTDLFWCKAIQKITRISSIYHKHVIFFSFLCWMCYCKLHHCDTCPGCKFYKEFNEAVHFNLGQNLITQDIELKFSSSHEVLVDIETQDIS